MPSRWQNWDVAQAVGPEAGGEVALGGFGEPDPARCSRISARGVRASHLSRASLDAFADQGEVSGRREAQGKLPV